MERQHLRPHRPAADPERLPDLADVVREGRDEAEHHRGREKEDEGQTHALQRPQQVFDAGGERQHHHGVHHRGAAHEGDDEGLDGETAYPRHPGFDQKGAARRQRHHRGHQRVEEREEHRTLQEERVDEGRGEEHRLADEAAGRHRQDRGRGRHAQFRARVEVPEHARLGRALSEQSPHASVPPPFFHRPKDPEGSRDTRPPPPAPRPSSMRGSPA